MITNRCHKPVKVQKKVLMLASALSVLALSTLAWTPAQAKQRNNIIFSSDFESGNLNGWDREGCCQYSNTLTSYPTRVGKSAYRSFLKPADKERSELKLDPFPKNAERWVGVSVYFPRGGYRKEFTSVFQFHLKPDSGQDWTSPPFQMIMKNDQLILKRYGKATTGSNQTWNLGSVPYGQWTDFVFHIKSSSKNDGLLEAWVNGDQKVSYHGVTQLNRSKGHFVKMGVYVGIGQHPTADTEIDYDEFRIGDENATYEDVAPGDS